MTSVAIEDWNPAQYLKFEDERTRPALDLLNRVPVRAPHLCMDLGCGPANSTELLVARYPEATVEGSDTSQAMLAQARERLPGIRFSRIDIAEWAPEPAYDIVLANAVLQWVPDHANLLPRLASALGPGGCLAVQVPDNLDEPSHAAMRRVAEGGPWASRLRSASAAKAAIGRFEDYYRWLRGAGCTVEIWKTTYVHPLAGAGAIVDWLKSTGLKPYLDPLPAAERIDFLARYTELVADAYPEQPDGKVLLRFPRLFILAQR